MLGCFFSQFCHTHFSAEHLEWLVIMILHRYTVQGHQVPPRFETQGIRDMRLVQNVVTTISGVYMQGNGRGRFLQGNNTEYTCHCCLAFFHDNVKSHCKSKKHTLFFSTVI